MPEQAEDAGSRPAPMRSWERLRRGNGRFVTDRPEHPGQDAAKRAELRAGQRPYAMIFGCSDSRVAAEIIFDQGLGDLFVVRTAGHVVDAGVLGSLEFGVAALGIPLVVVLGHDGCGAVRATVDALENGRMPPGFVRDVVERVTPSVLAARRQHDPAPPTLEQIEAEHIRQTASLITQRSAVIGAAVATSRCAVLPATYRLEDGHVHAVLGEG
jgi:carbonic anhydrase